MILVRISAATTCREHVLSHHVQSEGNESRVLRTARAISYSVPDISLPFYNLEHATHPVCSTIEHALLHVIRTFRLLDLGPLKCNGLQPDPTCGCDLRVPCYVQRAMLKNCGTRDGEREVQVAGDGGQGEERS